MRNIVFTLSLGLVVLCRSLLAADNPGFTPKDDPNEASTHFPEIQREARRINHLVRDALIIPTGDGFPSVEIAAFGALVRVQAGAKMPDGSFPKLSDQLRFFEGTLSRKDGYPVTLPTFETQRSLGTTSREQVYFFTGNDNNQGVLPLAGAEENVAKLHSLSEAISPYQINAKRFTIYEVRLKLLAIADDWDQYFTTGRPQTLWDIVATTYLERRLFQKNQIAGPPPRQWFVFHPNVVVENLQAAPDGDQLGGAVAIEWLGVNWWKGNDVIKIPIGISIASLYSDRRGVADVGHGVSLYLANKYCIGWANHGGDHGFYVSIDALKFIDSNKRKLTQYREQVGKYLR